MAAHLFFSSARRIFPSALACALMLGLAPPSQAGKPEWAGRGEGQGHAGEHGRAQEMGPRVNLRLGGYFGEAQRRVVLQDHERMLRAGHCPPGLAKKGTGCMPPGQAHKAYVLGQPLPPGVVYYELPPTLAVRLGPPPAGHRFVRVAADILLIAVGTGMVIDAMSDLGL